MLCVVICVLGICYVMPCYEYQCFLYLSRREDDVEYGCRWYTTVIGHLE